MYVQERYSPAVIAANSTNVVKSSGIGNFFCTVSGTITITNYNGLALVTTFAITAGETYDFNWSFQGPQGTITTAGGGAGVAGLY